MSFKIFFHPKAKQFILKLDTHAKERIKNKIKELKQFPEQRGKHLKYSNFWGLRIGDYRVIYEIHKQECKVIVLFIGHRKNVYDDFSKLM